MKGFDAINSISLENFKKMKLLGYSFAVLRLSRSSGKIDPTGISNMEKAREAGFDHVDAYIFPCRYISAKQQVKDALDQLNKSAATIQILWLDVEIGDATVWHNYTQEDNRQFILDMAEQAEEMNCHVGIYSMRRYWNEIVGKWNGMMSYPLWWCQYDPCEPNFNDYKNKVFGGWSKPYMKQYAENVRCEVAGCIDLNYMEGSGTNDDFPFMIPTEKEALFAVQVNEEHLTGHVMGRVKDWVHQKIKDYIAKKYTPLREFFESHAATGVPITFVLNIVNENIRTETPSLSIFICQMVKSGMPPARIRDHLISWMTDKVKEYTDEGDRPLIQFACNGEDLDTFIEKEATDFTMDLWRMVIHEMRGLSMDLDDLD